MLQYTILILNNNKPVNHLSIPEQELNPEQWTLLLTSISKLFHVQLADLIFAHDYYTKELEKAEKSLRLNRGLKSMFDFFEVENNYDKDDVEVEKLLCRKYSLEQELLFELPNPLTKSN